MSRFLVRGGGQVERGGAKREDFRNGQREERWSEEGRGADHQRVGKEVEEGIMEQKQMPETHFWAEVLQVFCHPPNGGGKRGAAAVTDSPDWTGTDLSSPELKLKAR